MRLKLIGGCLCVLLATAAAAQEQKAQGSWNQNQAGNGCDYGTQRNYGGECDGEDYVVRNGDRCLRYAADGYTYIGSCTSEPAAESADPAVDEPGTDTQDPLAEGESGQDEMADPVDESGQNEPSEDGE